MSNMPVLTFIGQVLYLFVSGILGLIQGAITSFLFTLSWFFTSIFQLFQIQANAYGIYAPVAVVLALGLLGGGGYLILETGEVVNYL